jgi:hypothetical protein
MNSSIKKILIFIAATFVIGMMVFLFSGDDGIIDGPENDSIAVKEFKSKCDSLRLKKWNRAAYKGLNSSLVAMKSQEIFTISEVANIQVYLNQVYAKTLKDSCASWLLTNGDNGDKLLLSEMSMLSGKSECSKMLSSEIQVMRAYYSALLMPAKIRNFTKSQYTLSAYNSLLSEINSTAKKQEIKHFPSMNKIASICYVELDDFQKYAKNFDGAYAYYNNNKGDFSAIEYLQRLCPESNPKTNLYTYYLQQLNVIENLCN